MNFLHCQKSCLDERLRHYQVIGCKNEHRLRRKLLYKLAKRGKIKAKPVNGEHR